MPKSKSKTVEPVDFNQFVLQDLKKEKRMQNVISIVLQDIYMFISRISVMDNPEWVRVEDALTEVDRSQYDEGKINREKDVLIRKLFILEEMRQYTNFLRKKNK